MLHFHPSRSETAKRLRGANAVPVYASLLSDQLTPVSAFERLAADDDHAFLLESVVGGEKIARYSFLGASPVAIVEARGCRTRVTRRGQEECFENVDPLGVLADVLGQYRSFHPPELPRFLGGAVGYAGYDIARHYEAKLASAPPDDRDLPDLHFGIYELMVVFDHVRKLIHLVAHTDITKAATPDAAYDDACARIESTARRLANAPQQPLRPLVTSATGTHTKAT